MEQGYHSLDSRESSAHSHTLHSSLWRGSCFCFCSLIKGYNHSKRNLNFLTRRKARQRRRLALGIYMEAQSVVCDGIQLITATVVLILLEAVVVSSQAATTRECWPSGNKVWLLLNRQSGHTFRYSHSVSYLVSPWHADCSSIKVDFVIEYKYMMPFDRTSFCCAFDGLEWVVTKLRCLYWIYFR